MRVGEGHWVIEVEIAAAVFVNVQLDAANARFARVLNAVAVFIQPNAVANRAVEHEAKIVAVVIRQILAVRALHHHGGFAAGVMRVVGLIIGIR